MATHIVEIIHTNPSITSLQAFIDEYEISMTVEELIAFPDTASTQDESLRTFGISITNGNMMLLMYKQEDGVVVNPDNLKVGTPIRVPIDKIAKESVLLSNNTVVPNTNFDAFLADKIKQILNNPSYKALNIDDLSQQKFYRINNKISVWIWCRTLGADDEDGKIFNVTPFVESISTTVGSKGGNFDIKLAPLTCEYTPDTTITGHDTDKTFANRTGGFWNLRKTTITQYQHGGENNVVVRESLYKRNSIGTMERNKFFFHHLISSNDVVFIRFERLEMENDRGQFSNNLLDNLTISPSDLPGKIYDMIGLVDTCPMSTTFDSVDVSISISGRDLMKTVLDDGCYFYPTDQVGSPNSETNTDENAPLTNAEFSFSTSNTQNITGNSNQNPLIQRLVSGEFNFFAAYVDRSIEYSLKFIFSALSVIEICPNKLFNFFTDRTTRISLDPENIDNPDSDFAPSIVTNYASGIWSIIKLVIDEQVAGRRLVDSSITTDSGSLLNFIGKICQTPFVEFYGDTYGDKYYFMARKPPFTEKSFISNFTLDVEEGDVYSESLSFDDTDVYSWYRLNPTGNFFGDDSGMSLWEFPVIYFEEYAKIWGSRPLEVVSNYIDYRAFGGDGKAVSLDYIEKQATQDLAFIIESHAYLPFTRKGTLTLKGDRRIKRGINIFNKATGEIFYVDEVNQQYSISDGSIDRVTTVSVSRGMIASELRKYFNIINLDKAADGTSGDRKKFLVNDEIFQFFLKRRQFK